MKTLLRIVYVGVAIVVTLFIIILLTNGKSTKGVSNNHEWVDLGLSVKWATCNVGAAKPEEYGEYYAWGETYPKNDYSWNSLKYCADTKGERFSKYNTEKKYGSIDNRRRLEMSDDAAHVNWGGRWRTPTEEEWAELKNNCTWTWTTMGRHDGYKVESNTNGNSIFLPAAGLRNGTGLNDAGSYGNYWSSSLYTDNPSRACIFDFYSDYVYGDYVDYRYYGRSIRPVTE